MVEMVDLSRDFDVPLDDKTDELLKELDSTI